MAEGRGSPALTFAVLLGLLAAMLAGAEAYARSRWTEEDVLPVPDMPFLQDDPLLLWRMRPDLDMPLWGGVHLRTNHEGLRAAERSDKAGRTRILSLGESTAWGHSVRAEDTYAGKLQARLTADGLAVDVVNAGQPAWSVWQSARFLETEGADWAPDVVLVYHLQNDIQTRGASNPRDPFRVALTDRQLSEARAPFAAVSRLLAASRLRAVLWKEVLAPRLTPPVAGASRDTVRVPDADRTLAFDHITAWCAEHHARLVLVQPVYGIPHRVTDRFVPAYAVAHDLPLVDLPTEKSKQGKADFFMVDDTHPTAEGHAWIAEQLEAALLPLLRASGGAP